MFFFLRVCAFKVISRWNFLGFYTSSFISAFAQMTFPVRIRKKDLLMFASGQFLKHARGLQDIETHSWSLPSGYL